MQNQVGAFGTAKATYVAICSVSILTLALVCSVWHSDASGTVALLGLLSVYMSSSELLMLFIALTPASIVLDIMRISGKHFEYGHSWLVFFTICSILFKSAGTAFAWMLHRAIATGDGGGAYQPISTAQGGGLPTASASAAQPPPPPYQVASSDPFAQYAPPRSDANGVSTTYQPFPTSTQSHV